MKRFFLSVALMSSVLYANAQQISTPQPSPTQTIRQNYATGTIDLSYSRPGLKGRVFGVDVVPYGKVWRTGANGATTIEFSMDVTIGNKSIKAGKYGLLSIPNEKEWTLILTKDLNVTQPNQYKQENDVVRVSRPVMKLAEKIETFTINFGNFTNSTCEMQLMWDNSAVSLSIATNTDEVITKQIDNAFNKDNKPYYAAAHYYYDNGKDITKAKEWIDKATADPANAKAFYMFMEKARIYKKAGDKAGAKIAAEKTIAVATEAQNDEYVKMAQDLIKTL